PVPLLSRFFGHVRDRVCFVAPPRATFPQNTWSGLRPDTLATLHEREIFRARSPLRKWPSL
ncbi:hypothetical protein, partial [Enterobacter cloacae]